MGTAMKGADAITSDIAADVRIFLKNPKIRGKDLLAWCTSETKPANDSELTFQIPYLPGYRYCRMWVTVLKVQDKRPPCTGNGCYVVTDCGGVLRCSGCHKPCNDLATHN